MEIKEVLKEVKAIAEDRKAIKEFNHPIIKLKNNFKGLGFRFSRNREIKENPIINLSWYKNIVGEVNKRANLINTDNKFYRFGVYIKFNGFLSIKYKPYVIKEGGKLQEERIKNNEILIENVFKNFARCGWCNRAINLKHKEEYGTKYNKILCCDCCGGSK